MGEPCDRLERFPEAAWRTRRFDDRAQRLHRVAVSVGGMPLRHEPVRLGEEQEQYAVDDRQRFIDEAPDRSVRSFRQKRLAQLNERCLNAVLERIANRRTVPFGNRHCSIECGHTIRRRHRSGAQERPQDVRGTLVIEGRGEFEFREAARVRSPRVE